MAWTKPQFLTPADILAIRGIPTVEDKVFVRPGASLPSLHFHPLPTPWTPAPYRGTGRLFAGVTTREVIRTRVRDMLSYQSFMPAGAGTPRA